MDNYFVFMWDTSKPKGGMNDFKGVFDTIPEAEEYIADNFESSDEYNYFEIFDIENMKAVV